MEIKKVYAYISERLLFLAVLRERISFSLFNSLVRVSQPLLFSIGVGLLVAGLENLSVAQKNPEPAQASNEAVQYLPDQNTTRLQDSNPEYLPDSGPEGVCCVDRFAEQTFTLGPEFAIARGPEGAFARDAERSQARDAERSQASDAVLGNGNALDPERLNPTDPEGSTPQDPEPLEANYDDSLSRFATGNLLRFIEGSFGALVMVGSGLGAIVAAAFGAYKASIALLFVAVGAFILRALVSLFFGTNYPAYESQFIGGDGV